MPIIKLHPKSDALEDFLVTNIQIVIDAMHTTVLQNELFVKELLVL